MAYLMHPAIRQRQGAEIFLLRHLVGLGGWFREGLVEIPVLRDAQAIEERVFRLA